MNIFTGEMACQELVELVTAYFDGSLSRSDRRRFAASLLESMLGGSASSRLFQEIRERRGMAYSVYTYASQYADTGMVGVYLGTREDNLAECIRIIADQFRLMGEGRFDLAELDRAKENLKGRIMLSMESTSNRASRLGKSVLTDAELLSLDRICAELPPAAHRACRLGRAVDRGDGRDRGA